MRTIVLSAVVVALTACSWGIKLDSGGRDVRVAWNDDVGACRSVGTITVSVLDNVGPIDRSALKISDELEVMARNEAAGMQADTIKPLGAVKNGEQRWAAYVCGATAPLSRPQRAPTDDGVETFPIKEH
jgi:hypothetical protein